MAERYWLFAGEIFYPYGGVHDLRGTYATLAEAEAQARAFHAGEGHEYCWHHIWDSVMEHLVAGTREQGYGVEDFVVPEEGRGRG